MRINGGKSIFSQLIGFLPDREFRRSVTRYDGDRYTKKLSCRGQYLAMAFAQLIDRESLRDIEACLGAIGDLCRLCAGGQDRAGAEVVDRGVGAAAARGLLRRGVVYARRLIGLQPGLAA
jgi:hypothetical protein